MTNPFRGLACKLVLVAGLVSMGGCAAYAPPYTPHLLMNTIEYRFVGQRETYDDEGRLLVWEAAVDGEVGSEMRWWFYVPPPLPTAELASARITYYRARWEILEDGELLVAGESAGKTVFSADAEGVWDGHGLVTEVQSEFESLMGSRIYETGPVVAGSNNRGMFVIY